ncbi:MAG TPA: inorganic phosphate transporter [Dissulfurispiraceae bacterium]|nr:inorganic phosphate transporter [Dissulfurispiraceae bacterium]
MVDYIPIIACVLMAIGMGSNDTSNAVGISIGCGLLKLKRAILLFGIFVLVGISVQGERVMKTVGKDIVEVDMIVLSLSCIVSATLIIGSNWKKIPLSILQVLIGSLAGAGTGAGAAVNYAKLGQILLSWAVSPFIALLLAHFLYRGLERVLSRYPVFAIERVLRSLLLASSVLIAYNVGANSLATIMGPAVHAGALGTWQAFILGSIGVFLGAYFLSYRVVETVGKGIIALDPFSGFAAQFGAGVCVLMFTFLGMPISTTYCIIGAISGVGLVKGMGTVRKDLLVKILRNWILGPTLGFGICFLFMRFYYA